MARLIVILLIGLVFESTGVLLLKKGMTQVGSSRIATVADVLHVVKISVSNARILLGVFFEALFFGCLLILMSKSEISFLWPLTALSFVFATLAAMWFLHEQVSPIRWAGVMLIMVGAALIVYSEHIKEKAPLSPPVASTRRSEP
jgi:drug/metabolite transporter (DMT)-like permease